MPAKQETKKSKSTKAARPEKTKGRPQTYADGHQLDTVQFLECKLILKPDRFDSMRGFYEFGTDPVREAAGTAGNKVKYEAFELEGPRPSMRQIRVPG